MDRVVLGYWNIRGVGEPIRTMLEYCDVSYEDKRYGCGDALDDHATNWLHDMSLLGLDFPSLPYLICGNIKLTQSFAIMKHIARKNKCLLPKSDLESDRCNLVEDVAQCFQNNLKTIYDNRETGYCGFFHIFLPEKKLNLDNYLKDKTWIAGETLTYVDFALAEYLDQAGQLKRNCFDECKHILNYLDRFYKLEKIMKYRESERFAPFPLY